MAAQCELLDLARSTYYYEPATESAENLALMRRIDEQLLSSKVLSPCGGCRKTAFSGTLGRYFDFYDHERQHQSLGKRTPYEVFAASLASTAQRRRQAPNYSLADSILN